VYKAVAVLFRLSLLLSFPLTAQDEPTGPFVDLRVTKSGPEVATQGSDITYTVTVINGGPEAAVNPTLRDRIPAETTLVSYTQAGGPTFVCTDGTDIVGRFVSCTIGSFAVNELAIFEIVVHVDEEVGDGTYFTNTASATTPAPAFENNEEDNSAFATTSTPAAPTADVVVQKDGPSAAGPGTNVVYTLTLINGGPDAAANVTLSDTLPGTMTFVSLQHDNTLTCETPAIGAGGTITCSAPSLLAGTTVTLTLTAALPGDASGEFFNTATVSADNDSTQENNSSSVTTVVSAVDLSVVKTGPATADAGTNLTYTIVIENAGPDTAIAVQLVDPVPSGTTLVSIIKNSGPDATCGGTSTVVCDFPAFGAGDTANLTLVLNPGTSTTVTNTATVAGDSFDSDGTNNSDQVTTTINQIADVSVAKTGPPTLTAGDEVTYAITVRNDGPSNALNVALSDVLAPDLTFVSAAQTGGPAFTCTPGTISCSIALLPAGSVATFTLTARLDPSTPAATSVANTAQVTTQTFDPDTNDHSATTTAISAVSADLSVTKSGPATIVAGSTVTYTITVVNGGPSTATNVTLSDVLPVGLTFVSATQTTGPMFTCVPGTLSCTRAALDPLTTATFALVADVDPNLPSGTTLTNTAQAATSATDPDSTDWTATTTATSTVGGAITVTKEGPPTIIANTNITYTIEVANSGPSNFAVTLTDALPPDTTFVSLDQSGPAFTCTSPAAGTGGTITCSAAPMTPGTTTFTLVLHVSPTATSPLSNTAVVNGTTSSTATAAVLPPSADLSITKSADRTTYAPGETVTYTIVVTNVGSFDALGVTVTDPIPAGMTLQSASSTQGTCSGTTTVTCTIGTMTPSASATITILAGIPASGGGFENIATVTSDNDINPANDAATVSVSAAATIPTMSSIGLALMALALAWLALRR
jgi:uncharacterized repeat protein (TIGR01451 family)